MPQGLLPLFSDDCTPINELLSYQERDGMVYYFHGGFPVFCHAVGDEASFRMFTSQLYVNGLCKEVEIAEAFGVTSISVKRSVKKYREEGPGAFFQKRAPARKPRVLTAEVLKKAQALFDAGRSRGEVAEALGIKADTLYRAVREGRLVEEKKTAPRG